MNVVKGYGSDSEDEPIASGSRLQASQEVEGDFEDVQVDASDVFGLATMGRNGHSVASNSSSKLIGSALVRTAPEVSADVRTAT